MRNYYRRRINKKGPIKNGRSKTSQENGSSNVLQQGVPLNELEGGRRVCRHMIEIWNRTIPNKLYLEKESNITPKRQKRLTSFLKEVLEPYGESWESYCLWIVHSDLIKTIDATEVKVSLDWALIPSTSQVILEAAFNNEPNLHRIIQGRPWGEFFEEIKESCASAPYGSEWFQISQTLARRIGQSAYKVWFSGARLIEFTQNIVVIHVESAFNLDYIFTYLFLDVVYAVQSAYPTINRINFEIGR